MRADTSAISPMLSQHAHAAMRRRCGAQKERGAKAQQKNSAMRSTYARAR